MSILYENYIFASKYANRSFFSRHAAYLNSLLLPSTVIQSGSNSNSNSNAPVSITTILPSTTIHDSDDADESPSEADETSGSASKRRELNLHTEATMEDYKLWQHINGEDDQNDNDGDGDDDDDEDDNNDNDGDRDDDDDEDDSNDNDADGDEHHHEADLGALNSSLVCINNCFHFCCFMDFREFFIFRIGVLYFSE